MPVDANGVEITVGCTVKHKHEPLPAGEWDSAKHEPHRVHNFFGKSEVVDILRGGVVVVKPTMRAHIPVHCPGNVIVCE